MPSFLDKTKRILGGGTPSGGGGGSGALLAGGPPPATTPDQQRQDQGPKPLGVPRDYRVPSVVTERPAQTADSIARHAEAGLGQGAVVSRGPRYYDGAQWTPAAASPQSVAQIQRAMATAGLLSDFTLGVWDSKTADAYAEVLTYANASGLDDQTALQQMVEAPRIDMGQGSGSGGGRRIVGFNPDGSPIYSEYVAPPLEIKPTNRDDLKRMFRSLTAEKLGVGWTDEQLNELVDGYNWQEVRVARQNYDQQVAMERTAFNEGPQAVAGQTFTTEQAPSPETFAENQLIARDPTGYQAAQVGLNSVDMFEQALGKWR